MEPNDSRPERWEPMHGPTVAGMKSANATALACTLGFFLLMARPAHSAPDAERPVKTVTFTTNLLSPFFGAYYVDATLRASRAFGILLDASYFAIDNGAFRTHTGTVGAGFSYYFQGDALRRWYVEANTELMLSHWRHEPSGNTASLVPGFTFGSVAGHRFIWDSGAVLDFAAGAVMMHFPSARVETDAGPVSSKALTRVYPAIKVNVGWAF